jgi:predicted alpha/beta hydrolase family esterase
MTTINEYSTELACALNGYRALIVPDIGDSDAQHWQSLWEQSIPRTRRIRLHDWQTADWVKWRNSIIASLISIDEPVVLIAEGFGALAAASVAAEYPGKIIAAFLVDPSDPDDFDVRKKIPKQPLPIPTKIVIRNQTDTKAALLAALWSTDLSHSIAIEPATTELVINNSAINFWPEGIRALNRLISKTQRKADEITQARTRKIMAYLRTLKKPKASSNSLNFNYS